MRLPRWRPALSGAMVAASTVAACETYTGRSHLQFHSFGAHPNPADRGLDTGGHAVLPPALSPAPSHMR